MTLRSGGVEHGRIPALVDGFYEKLITEIAEVEGLAVDSCRFVFSIVAVLRFARLANSFARLRSSWLSSSPGFQFKRLLAVAASKFARLAQLSV